MRFNYKHVLILLFTTLFITINFTSTACEPIDNTLQKRQYDGEGNTDPKKVVDPSSTCTTPSDARCKSPPGVPPKVETYVEIGIETITPTPIPGENNNININTTNLITTTTTTTLYFAGYTTTITTKNSRGEPTTFATSILPSTLLVIKTVVVTAPAIEKSMDVSDSTTNFHDFNKHGLWGVTMSLALIVTTLIFMLFV
ncbi:hypothetical protein C1645_760226 [Glomus cerebriforme]|uniref:Uncharacterized protein n=1 Tax=Glomus cerebriforme TaxID=658196 RepID=A0A397TH98_9GLOM|nr:hypothetical protein C1645_760226 [Glomus cerebriforme]